MSKESKPRVYLVGTGGSISFVGASRTDYINYSYDGKHLTIEEMLQRVPEVLEFADVRPEQFLNLGNGRSGSHPRDCHPRGNGILSQLDGKEQ